MKVGDKFIIDYHLVRSEKDIKDRLGWSRCWKFWERKNLPKEFEVIYLGKRTLSNGYADYFSREGITYHPKEYIKTLLVCPTDGRTNPFYIFNNERQ